MARPRKLGLDYFPHDVDVTTDPKIEPAILRYGAAAYAFYFVHLEYCYRSDDLCVDVSATEIGTEMREVIQRKLHISAEEYDLILKSFLRHGAFDSEFYTQTGKLTSHGIKKRAEKVFGKREREAVRYSESVSGDVSATETGAETGERKAKQSTEKNSKQNIVSDDRFQQFWATYPRKVGKGAALKAWMKIKPSADLHSRILKAIEEQKNTPQWTRDDGQFIPHPATWLNQGRWDDETPNRQSAQPTNPPPCRYSQEV